MHILLCKLIFKFDAYGFKYPHHARIQAGRQACKCSLLRLVFILTHASTCRHLTSFVISSRNVYSSTNSGDVASPPPSVTPKPPKGSGGGAGSGGTGSSKDPVIKIPGRKQTVTGGYSGFAEVVFSLERRQQAAQKLAVSLDGTTPHCQQQYFLTSVSVIRPYVRNKTWRHTRNCRSRCKCIWCCIVVCVFMVLCVCLCV
jgi:hypothetical protein